MVILSLVIHVNECKTIWRRTRLKVISKIRLGFPENVRRDLPVHLSTSKGRQFRRKLPPETTDSICMIVVWTFCLRFRGTYHLIPVETTHARARRTQRKTLIKRFSLISSDYRHFSQRRPPFE